MRKLLIIIGIVILGIVSLYFFFSEKTMEKVEYISWVISKKDITSDITATGSINASQTIDVGTQVSGIVSKILVDYNDIVKQGQVIALIDTIALVSSVIDAEANMLKARTQLIYQKNEFDRYTELFSKKAVSQSEFDLINANYLSAKSSFRSAEAQFNRAIINLKYATITAPIGGVVVSRDVNVGQTIAANFSTPKLFTIANDLTKMQLQAKIDEADIGNIKQGQEVVFTVDAYPGKEFTGVVQQIRLQPIINQNVVTYNVIIDAPNPALKLLPGMTANAIIKVEEHTQILAIPLSAIFFTPSEEYENISNTTEGTIWVECIDAGKDCIDFNGVKMKQLTIQKGIDDGMFIEISGVGVAEGIKVITGIRDSVKYIRKKDRDLIPDKDDKKGW